MVAVFFHNNHGCSVAFVLLIAILLFIGNSEAVPAANESYCPQIDCTGRWTRGLPHEVSLGTYINSLAAFDVEQSTIRFDAYVWLKWDPCAVNPNDDNIIFKPHETLRIENALNKVDLTKQNTYENPICVRGTSEGDFVYFEMRIEGEFFQKLTFKNYPVDRHDMRLVIEDVEFPRDQLRYVKDSIKGDGHSTSAISPRAKLSGWTITAFGEKESGTRYKTETFEEIYGSGEYSHYEFSVRLWRGAVFYIFRVLPPIVITLIISGMVLLLDVEALDTRIATAVGGLLACIFLQLTIGANLPSQVDYITLMDWIFNLSYIMLILILVENLYIRKVYYRYLLQHQDLLEQMKMKTLNEEEAKELGKDWKRRKDKVKRRIRVIEKYVYGGYLAFGGFFILIISLAAGLA